MALMTLVERFASTSLDGIKDMVKTYQDKHKLEIRSISIIDDANARYRVQALVLFERPLPIAPATGRPPEIKGPGMAYSQGYQPRSNGGIGEISRPPRKP